jgi:hypothetical protein
VLQAILCRTGPYIICKEAQSPRVAARQTGGYQEKRRRFSEATAPETTEVLQKTLRRDLYEAHTSGRVGPDTRLLYD